MVKYISVNTITHREFMNSVGYEKDLYFVSDREFKEL